MESPFEFSGLLDKFDSVIFPPNKCADDPEGDDDIYSHCDCTMISQSS